MFYAQQGYLFITTVKAVRIKKILPFKIAFIYFKKLFISVMGRQSHCRALLNCLMDWSTKH